MKKPAVIEINDPQKTSLLLDRCDYDGWGWCCLNDMKNGQQAQSMITAWVPVQKAGVRGWQTAEPDWRRGREAVDDIVFKL
jgi:hypothetical protein